MAANERRSSDETDWSDSQKELDEIQRSWILRPQDKIKKKKYVNFGYVVCSHSALKWTVGSLLIVFLVIGLPIIVSKNVDRHKKEHHHDTIDDGYSEALAKALLFFDAQKSGKLPKNNRVKWRGNSGLNDGEKKLVGGYYDAGNNIKFHFPMAFSMTMLSWSVIEYGPKYKALHEYDHVRELIKWGTDYLLKSFTQNGNSTISTIYSQVGGPDDLKCWERPEDMDYPRPVVTARSAPDLAAEMAAALAAASIVFKDNAAYSKKLVNGAAALYTYATTLGQHITYSKGEQFIEPYYNSTAFYDEHLWSAAWMFLATGSYNPYLSRATDVKLARKARELHRTPGLSVLSWDNKLPAVELLLTRLRLFLNPGYPYEDLLSRYHESTGLNMCSYLKHYNGFKWTKGGLIQLKYGSPRPLQYAANAAFLASLFVDYMKAHNIPGWNCGDKFATTDDLHHFATSQINYILGANPMKMSYVVGYGERYPRHVHHRGASIKNNTKPSCKDGWKIYKSADTDPNNITGAMVGGPYKDDKFEDFRGHNKSVEPTLAGNAGLVAALVSLTKGNETGVDRNTIFTFVPTLPVKIPSPPPPWNPWHN